MPTLSEYVSNSVSLDKLGISYPEFTSSVRRSLRGLDPSKCDPKSKIVYTRTFYRKTNKKDVQLNFFLNSESIILEQTTHKQSIKIIKFKQNGENKLKNSLIEINFTRGDDSTYIFFIKKGSRRSPSVGKTDLSPILNSDLTFIQSAVNQITEAAKTFTAIRPSGFLPRRRF